MWTNRGRPKSACKANKSTPVAVNVDVPESKSTTYSDAEQPLLDPHPPITPPARPPIHKDTQYLGISESLVYTLVDVYFENAYNANLLLNKGRFLESLVAGTVADHLILSLCAYAANFYRDRNGEAPLRDHGFMIEWAKRAGSLVFRDAESLCGENIVTFCILATFWYAQGSWRLSYLHKANACNLLQVAGISFVKHHAQNSLESEIQRRRLWSCYFMHCALMENPASFEPIANLSELPLPSADPDFEAGFVRGPFATFENGRSGASILAELIRGFRLWGKVFALVKLPEASVADRFTKIYSLDDSLVAWWSALKPDYRLTPATLPSVPSHQLPGALLMNITYHQSMCALHASVVPLFSWTPSENNWASARQASAQKTYEHAVAISDLIAATLDAHPKLAMTHSFIAYAAYSGCAVQIPFTWSSNPVIKKRATTNVSQNMRMIRLMTPYWKFAALLERQLGCLFRIHEKFSVDLEDEPRNVDIRKLIGFKINAVDARKSILGFTDILRSRDHGYVNSGEENNDPTIQDQPDEDVQQQIPDNTPIDHEAPNTDVTRVRDMDGRERNLSLDSILLHSAESMPPLNSNECGPDHQPQAQAPPSSYTDQPSLSGMEQQSYDVWPPFFHPTMLDVLPDSEMLNLPQVDLSSVDLDYLEPENWFLSTNSIP
ncbi:hypothetical protein B0A52_08319 [Exophiala mesophila]|uniref:Xylanolytic transcriptional activator regulatory domain-containing protein n=1 Tax=Exophiala mesophila TaxID=212818 RepID=A0A438MVF4_EXOME|nr:hypothetical protein B0A52_08319 [Exophiala mesophila]